MNHRPTLWIALAAVTFIIIQRLLAAPAGVANAGNAPGGVQILSTIPVPGVPPGWTEPMRLAPSGHWALFHSYGPAPFRTTSLSQT